MPILFAFIGEIWYTAQVKCVMGKKACNQRRISLNIRCFSYIQPCATQNLIFFGICRISLAVRTLASHAGNRGSIPLCGTKQKGMRRHPFCLGAHQDENHFAQAKSCSLTLSMRKHYERHAEQSDEVFPLCPAPKKHPYRVLFIYA